MSRKIFSGWCAPTALSCLLASGMLPTALAADYRVETLQSGAPTDELSAAVAEALAPTGVRVVRGEKRTVCEIWPCQEWDVAADFTANSEVLYPFQPGQLIGVLQFRRRGSDFRDQRIDRGVYTLRYAQQPIDGNHEGTSPTRDFLLMVRAEDDASTDTMPAKELEEASAEAAGSDHPAMMCMQRPSSADVATPSLRHDEDRDWWVLRVAAPVSGDAQGEQLAIEVVVVGVAEE